MMFITPVSHFGQQLSLDRGSRRSFNSVLHLPHLGIGSRKCIPFMSKILSSSGEMAVSIT